MDIETSWRSWPRLRRLDWRSALTDILLIAIAIFVVGQGYLRPGIPLSDDLRGNQMLDSYFWCKALLEEGALTRWDFTGGTPMGVFHPLPVSYLVISFFHFFLGLFAATRIAVLFLLMLGAAGMYLLLRAWVGSRLAAVAGGLFYVWAHPNIIEHVGAGHIDMTCVLAIFPYYFYLLERSLQNGDRRLAAVNSLLFALMFCSDLQFFIFAALISALYILFRTVLFRNGSLVVVIRQHGAVYAITYGWGSLLCVYTLVTTLSYKPFFAFYGYSEHWKYAFSAGFWHALGLWAKAWHYLIVNPASIKGMESIDPFYGWCLPLVVLALLAYRRAPALFAAALYLVSLFLVLGMNTPLMPLLYKLPVFKYFRVPIRFYYLMVFSLSLFVGFACAAVPRLAAGAIKRRLLALGLPCLVLIMALGVGNPPYAWEMFRTYGPPSGSLDLKIYSYLNSCDDRDGFESVPYMTTGADRDERVAVYYHGRRCYNASHWHLVGREMGALKDFVNIGLEMERLSVFMGTLNVGDLCSKLPDCAASLGRLKDLELVLPSGRESGDLYRNRRVLPLIRGVGNCVLIAGEKDRALVEDLFNSSGFQPAEDVVKYVPDEAEPGPYDMAVVGEPLRVYGYRNAVYLPHSVAWRDSRYTGQTGMEARDKGVVFSVAGKAGDYNVWTLQLDGLELKGACQLSFRGNGSENASFAFKFLADGIEGPVPRRTMVAHVPEALNVYRIDLSDIVKTYAGSMKLKAIQIVLITTNGDKAEMYLEDLGFGGPDWAYSLGASLLARRAEFTPRYARRAPPVVRRTVERRYSGRYEIEVECPEDIGYLVVAEPWYPNWKVKVDGKRVEPFRAYTALLGVELKGRGGHRVVIWQGMLPLQVAGRVVSFLALIGVLFYYFLPGVRRRWGSAEAGSEEVGSRLS